MPQSDRRQPWPIRWWEGLSPFWNLGLGLLVFGALSLVANLVAFNQPLLRSLLYALIEGGVLSALLAIATQTERGKRIPPDPHRGPDS
ncbi:MAG TPA: hypothetical protein VMU49_02395 [Candidatus Acidoferrales bacterium]|nr:hypothetical protein [Candidatus Acidoferrales bacterium]